VRPVQPFSEIPRPCRFAQAGLFVAVTPTAFLLLRFPFLSALPPSFASSASSPFQPLLLSFLQRLTSSSPDRFALSFPLGSASSSPSQLSEPIFGGHLVAADSCFYFVSSLQDAEPGSGCVSVFPPVFSVLFVERELPSRRPRSDFCCVPSVLSLERGIRVVRALSSMFLRLFLTHLRFLREPLPGELSICSATSAMPCFLFPQAPSLGYLLQGFSPTRSMTLALFHSFFFL